MADEDDLYADLYADDTVTTNQAGKDETKKDATATSSAAAPSKSSFIPPAPSTVATNNSSNSNNVPVASKPAPFLPPPAASTSFVKSPPMSNAPPVQGSQIETAPMTNSDNRQDNAQQSYKPIIPPSGASDRQLQPHEMPDEGKLFVGGLNWETSDEGLKNYFSQYGKVTNCLIMRDPQTGRSRGFAFLTFDDGKAINSVMVKEHFLDGKLIDPKRAIPRQENIKTAKCFVGGIPPTANSESFRTFFEQFGQVLDSTLMLDRDSGLPRGYGFITYSDDSIVENLISMDDLIFEGKVIEVKRATPRNPDGTRRTPNNPPTRRGGAGGDDYNVGSNQYSVGGGSNRNDGMNSGDMSNANPFAAMMMNPMFAQQQQQQQFDPTAMAQMFQQFQSGAGGGAFNPAMFQQMMSAMGNVGNNSQMGPTSHLGGSGGNNERSYQRDRRDDGGNYRNQGGSGVDAYRRERSPDRRNADGNGRSSTDRWAVNSRGRN